MTTNTSKNFVNGYLENLLLGNRTNSSAIAHQYLEQTPSIKHLYEQVLKVALYEVGRLWETNQITAA